MTTLRFPLSRIEGHARVEMEVQNGTVVSAQFQAIEMRGFRYFMQGTPAEQMPVIVPRICGVCSTAHHVASVKALENIFDVTPPKLAEEVRELLLLGQLIQNQATSLFIFTMPDRVGASSIFHIDESEADPAQQLSLAQRSLKVRQIGTKLITLAGGQFIHPVKAIIGGVTSGIKAEDAEIMREEMEAMLPVACELFDEYWAMSLKMKDRIGTWGDDQPAYYIASTGRSKPQLNSNTIRILGPDGVERASFPPRLFREYLEYQETEYSYAGQSSYQGGVMRANSLARVNLALSMGTPCADDYLDRLTSTFGKPAHPILLFDLCRGIELVYAFERAIEMLSKDLNYEHTSVPYSLKDGEGYGLVEAPRGPLIHHYKVRDGLIEDAEFIIPTVHNMLAIERALMVAGERYITPEGINLELEKAVGRVVRAFDPCIAC
ncbi:MAG: Ni/Fe hydrogenase subunit alpha, partial [Chloroflexota bacterium]|nr:Ni/Fe hydrogenase subunit alpha [Chloroflexota bacterium]